MLELYLCNIRLISFMTYDVKVSVMSVTKQQNTDHTKLPT